MNSFTKLVLWQIILIAITFFTDQTSVILGIERPVSLGAFALVFCIATLVASLSISMSGLAVISVSFIVVLSTISTSLPLIIGVVVNSTAIASATTIVVRTSNIKHLWILTTILIEAASILASLHIGGIHGLALVVSGIAILISLAVFGKTRALRPSPSTPSPA